jgi:hypothetical protein
MAKLVTVDDIADAMIEIFATHKDDREAMTDGLVKLEERVSRDTGVSGDPLKKMMHAAFVAHLPKAHNAAMREFAKIQFESFSAAGRKPN